MTGRPLILGIGGTMRPGSTSEMALRISLAAAEATGAATVALTGRDLCVPMYGLDSGRSAEADRLVRLMRDCDGIIVSSPSFHGSISGAIKNALDYSEDLREGERTYLEGIAFGTIVCAAGWQAVGTTLTTMRAVAHALRAWPTPMGAGINSLAAPFDAEGRCTDEAARFQLELVGRQVADFARMSRSTSDQAEQPRFSLAASR